MSTVLRHPVVPTLPCRKCGRQRPWLIGIETICSNCAGWPRDQIRPAPPPPELTVEQVARRFDFIIMRGLPGAGKSYWARHLNGLGFYVHSADAFFTDANGVYLFDKTKLPEAHGLCFREVTRACQDWKFRRVVVDNTNISAVEIAGYWQLAKAFCRVPAILNVRCDVQTAIARQTHGAPEQTIQRMAQVLAEEKLSPWWTIINLNTAD